MEVTTGARVLSCLEENYGLKTLILSLNGQCNQITLTGWLLLMQYHQHLIQDR